MRSYNQIIEEITSKETTFIRKILFFVSPVTEDYEYRVAYFTDAMEAITWENEMKQKYAEQRFRHIIKTDYVHMKKEN